MSDVLNHALRLSLEWGENFGKPIDQRLLRKFPQLTVAQVREADTAVRALKEFAFKGIELVYFQKETEEHVRAEILKACPWIDPENLSHLWSQGMYYAWHG